MGKYFAVILLLFTLLSLHAQNIETVVQRSGGGDTRDLSISEDGLYIARVDNSMFSSEIEIWNVKTGHLLRVIRTNNKADFNNSLQKVRFWQNGRYVITGTLAGIHEIYEVSTGKLVKKIPVTSYIGGAFAICEKTGVFAFLDPIAFTQNEIILYDLYSGTVFDTLRIAVDYITCLEFSPDGTEIATGTKNGSFHLVEIKSENGKRNIRNAINVYKGTVSFVQWTRDNYLLAEDNNEFSFWNITNGKMIQKDSLEPGCRIITSPTEDCFYKAGKSSLARLNPMRKEQKIMGVKPDFINTFSIDEKNERMYILTHNFIKVWDLRNIAQVQSIRKDQVTAIYSLPFAADKQDEIIKFLPGQRSLMVADSGKITLKAIDTTFKEKSYSLPQLGIDNFIISASNEPIAGLNDKIAGWENGQPFEIKTGSKQKILFRFPQTKSIAAAGKKDSVFHIYELPGVQQKSLSVKGNINCGAASPTGKQFAIAGTNLYLFDAKTFTKKELYDPAKEDFVTEYQGAGASVRIDGNYKQVIFSLDGQKIFAIDFWGKLKVWNLRVYKIDTIINLHAGFIELSPDGKQLFIGSNNELIWMNSNNFKKNASIAFLEEGDYIVSLPDNYYKSSRNGAKAVAFSQGMKTSGFDQYDLVFNRPDIVTKKLGNPTAEMQESLDKTVIKRIKKMGISDTSRNIFQVETPEVNIKNYSTIPTTTTEPLLNFTIELRDKSSFITTCFIFNNGVPDNGKSGFNIISLTNGKKVNELSINYSMLLDQGKNLIEVSCLNEKGISSARESFEIYYNDTTSVKSNLYFIGIGAGRYKDSSRNLKYPSKDISDVASLFKNKSRLYNNVDITILSDEMVNADNIKNLRKKLDLTNTRDEVIIYWSGHGLLSKDLDYYLAGYNTDFIHPENGSIAYEDIENLFDSIPARKRLLFIDACHSGEIDKDEVKLVQKDTVTAKNTSGNAKGIIITKRQKSVTSSLLNELFSDIRRSTGANVISAAGGSEFALEGDKWGNGVFTYVLINGLSEKKADYNKDGEITISELQAYLQAKVPELTNGRQTPTSRTENLVNDWRLW